MVRSVEPRDTLSLLLSAQDQNCLQGPYERSPVLFGLDSVSGCTLRHGFLTLEISHHITAVTVVTKLSCSCRLEDAASCSMVSQLLLGVLRGPSYPQYVASFGNSPLSNSLDWVEIQSSVSPEVSAV